MHNNKLVHCDLKLEHILFKTVTDVCIIDFGASQFIKKNGQLYSCVGTRGYQAPEMIIQSGYGYPVDVWALGIILFSLVFGYNPFSVFGVCDENTNRKILCGFENVIKDGHGAYFPKSQTRSPFDPPQELRDLIVGMLDFSPYKRPTVTQILASEWMAG
jgi:calcium/calmodulin-dependent protein kinase I